MTQFNAPTYDIQRPTGKCAFSGRTLEPGEPYIATLIELDEAEAAALVKNSPTAPNNSETKSIGFRRLDVSIEAWQQGQKPERVFSFWRSVVQPPNAKRKVFVDDQVLLDLLRRLGEDDRPGRQAFRFVLALVLMRKKLLRFDGQETRNGADGKSEEWWTLTPKGQEEPLTVLNAQLDEQQIQSVTEQLGEILEAEI